MRNWTRAAVSQIRLGHGAGIEEEVVENNAEVTSSSHQSGDHTDNTSDDRDSNEVEEKEGSGENEDRFPPEERRYRARVKKSLTPYYRARMSKLKYSDLRDALVQLTVDEAAQEFIKTTPRRGMVKSFACWCLQFFLSPTDSLGWLGFGRMHVLSLNHTRQLLSFALRKEISLGSNGTLLDVGAGTGTVTESLAPLFEKVVTTELSPPMAQSLRERGYECVETGDPGSSEELLRQRFDVVTCFNVLDRCSKPLSLLRSIRKMLTKTGRGLLILAVVFPFEPYVESGTETLEPEETIELGLRHLKRPSWEASVSAFYSRVLSPLGYEVRALAKLPYISEGDYNRDYYLLTDAVFVLSPGILSDDDNDDNDEKIPPLLDAPI